MPTLPPEIITLLSCFACVFTCPSWKNAQLLLTGAILCCRARRISSILKIMGLGNEKRFEKYHRFLNRAQWNGLALSKILLGLLLKLVPESCPILIAIDETIERRKGKRIKAIGCYRDAVRSSESTVIKCFGLKWNCMALLVKLPWCSRAWALPFMTVLGPSKKANEAAGRKHKTSIDWAIIMMKVVCQWLGRSWILIGDGGYACMDFAWACVKNRVTLISRLRLDAQLYEFPKPVPAGKRGRKPLKGKRIHLKKLVDDKKQDWIECNVPWYGGQMKTVKLLSKVCLWYQSGKKPLPLRYVLVVDPTGKNRTEAFFSTDVNLAPEKIVEWFVLRWSIEVTFQETREHLGVETQRQWSDKAIARSTPLLMGLFSLVTLIALQLRKTHKLTLGSSAWYNKKDEATFSDIIGFVRHIIWSNSYLSKSANDHTFIQIDKRQFNSLINQLARAA